MLDAVLGTESWWQTKHPQAMQLIGSAKASRCQFPSLSMAWLEP